MSACAVSISRLSLCKTHKEWTQLTFLCEYNVRETTLCDLFSCIYCDSSSYFSLKFSLSSWIWGIFCLTFALISFLSLYCVYAEPAIAQSLVSNGLTLNWNSWLLSCSDLGFSCFHNFHTCFAHLFSIFSWKQSSIKSFILNVFEINVNFFNRNFIENMTFLI